MPMGMDDDLWLEQENDRLQEEADKKERLALEAEIDDDYDEAMHQSRIDDGYYNEYD